MSDWLGLKGRRVLVVGAGGFGHACAKAFVQAGSRVFVSDIDDGRLDLLLTELTAGSDDISVVAADARNPQACDSLVSDALRGLGGIDVFVHTVGQNIRKPFTKFTQDEWASILSTNLSSAFWLGQAVGRVMLEQSYGRMVYISSVSGLLAHELHAPYAASKGGLNQLMRVMAAEWALHGINVNAIAPGYTETPLTEEYLSRPGVRDALTGLVPTGRLGQIEDIVGPVLFLSSDRASFINGHVLYVDGGRTLI